MNQSSNGNEEEQKRIIILDDIKNTSKIGILVDDVLSVLAVDPSMIDYSINQGSDSNRSILGIIKHRYTDKGTDRTDLIIWVDIIQLLENH